MNSWYLLPCTCGKSTRILARHAGESRTCDCGAELKIPRMREIRQLEQVTVAEPAEATQPRKGWSPLKGLIFVTGVPILLIGLGIAVYSFWFSNKIKSHYSTTKPTAEEIAKAAPFELFRMDIDKLTVLETVEEVWKPLIKESNLPGYIEPRHIFYRELSDDYVRRGKWAAMAAAAGGLLSVIALILPSKR